MSSRTATKSFGTPSSAGPRQWPANASAQARAGGGGRQSDNEPKARKVLQGEHEREECALSRKDHHCIRPDGHELEADRDEVPVYGSRGLFTQRVPGLAEASWRSVVYPIRSHGGGGGESHELSPDPG